MTGAPLYARWTTERHEQLCVLVAEGKSGAQIATEMGGLTRSAVMGRMSRNKIKSLNQAPGRDFRAPKKRVRPKGSDGGNTSAIKAKRRMNEGPDRAPILPQFVNASLDEFNLAIPVEQRKPIVELENNSCRWPINDGPDYLFCGSPDADMSRKVPYCGYHSRIAGAGYTRERGYGFKRSVNTYR